MQLPIDPTREVISGDHPISLLTGKPILYYPGTGNEPVLGEGSYGAVYQYQTDAGPVAIKISDNVDETIQSGVLLELASVINLHHPNVIPLLDAFFLQGATVLVYPLAEGTINKIPYDPIITKAMFFQIIRGVAYLHSKDIYHGDLKPQNILYDKDPKTGTIIPKIADFGLARSARCYVKEEEQVAMTIWWRPPELLLEGKYGDNTDTWTLGCIYYEMIVGRPLFRGMNENAMIDVIASKLGPIDEKTWPGVSLLPKWKDSYAKLPRVAKDSFSPITDPEILRIISSMVQLDPAKRVGLIDLMADPYFDDVRNVVIPEPPLTSLDCEVALLNNIMPAVGDLAHARSPTLRLGLGPSHQVPQSKGSQMPLNEQRTLYEWMMELQQQEWHISDRAMALAVALYERYTTLQKPSRENWQGYAVSAMVISTFMESIFISTSDASFMTDNAYTPETLLQMERDIITVCGPNLYAATGYDIMKVYLENYPENVNGVASTLYQLAYFTSLSSKYGHKEIALACIEMACKFLKVSFNGKSNPDAIRKFRYDLSSLLDVEREPIYDLVKRGTFLTKEIIKGL